MKGVKFTDEPGSKEIVAMVSVENEQVDFVESVMAKGKVEDWLGQIEAMMRLSLYRSTKESWNRYPSIDEAIERKSWLWAHYFPEEEGGFCNPAAVVLIV